MVVNFGVKQILQTGVYDKLQYRAVKLIWREAKAVVRKQT